VEHRYYSESEVLSAALGENAVVLQDFREGEASASAFTLERTFVEFEVDEIERNENEHTKGSEDNPRGRDRLIKPYRQREIPGCKLKQNKPSNQNTKDLTPRLYHAGLVRIRNFLDNQRVQSDVLQDHSHHHDHT
jgi:hypothetical protein